MFADVGGSYRVLQLVGIGGDDRGFSYDVQLGEQLANCEERLT